MIGAAALLVLAVTWAGGLLPSIGNPFGTDTVDRTGPAVLQAVRDISEYRAATGEFQVVVDLEEDVRFVPSRISGERTLFVATGSADAGVDLGGLDEEGVRVSEDGTEVTISLPPVQLYEASVDPEASYVVDRERGVLDRIGSVFSDSPTGERELYLVAEERITAAAQEAGLRERAEANTRAMLEALMGSLGYETVRVRFAESPPT